MNADTEFISLIEKKEEAVANQDFELAAMYRDQADKLKHRVSPGTMGDVMQAQYGPHSGIVPPVTLWQEVIKPIKVKPIKPPSYNKRLDEAREIVTKAEAELEKAKENLAAVRESRFPNGRFCIARPTKYSYKNGTYLWHRGASHHDVIGVSNVSGLYGFKTQKEIRTGVYVCNSGGYGKVTTYASIERMQSAAKRFGISDELVHGFLDHYHASKLGANQVLPNEKPSDEVY